MKYLTHIPTLPHVERERVFYAQRAQARESLVQLSTAHDLLLRACQNYLRRNYIDSDTLETSGRQIVKLSTEIRGLRQLAKRPIPPRYEPARIEDAPEEDRTYAGVKASRLVRALRFLRCLRDRNGDLTVARRVRRLSGRLAGGLDVYNRVKAVIRNLTAAVDNPADAIRPRTPQAPKPHTPGTPRPTFTWETSPQKIYGWSLTLSAKGYDPRQTSVYWLEKQAVSLKGAIYRAHHGIERPASARKIRRARTEDNDIQTRHYHPPEGAQVTGQIWPPIDLVRVIEERRANTRHANTECDTNGALDAEDKNCDAHSPSPAHYSSHIPCDGREDQTGSLSAPPEHPP